MADVQFNPMDPEFVADPYPMYQRLQADDPVHHSPLGFWVLTRYADVIASLRDPRLIKEPIAAFVAARFGMAVPPGLGLSMLDRDPPDHTRLRGLVSKAFTLKALERLRPGIQQIVNELLDRVEGHGEMDLIDQFAYPLPVNVICDMLGVPVRDHERFKQWGLDIARGLDAIMLPPDSEIGQRSVAGGIETDAEEDVRIRVRLGPRGGHHQVPEEARPGNPAYAVVQRGDRGRRPAKPHVEERRPLQSRPGTTNLPLLCGRLQERFHGAEGPAAHLEPALDLDRHACPPLPAAISRKLSARAAASSGSNACLPRRRRAKHSSAATTPASLSSG